MKWVIWGDTRRYNTFSNFWEGWQRALRHLGREVLWLDRTSNLAGIDFSNTVFVSQNRMVHGVPLRKDCWYVVHNGDDTICECLRPFKLLVTNLHQTTTEYNNPVMLGPDIYFMESERRLNFRHNALLLPHEIMANKPTKVFNEESQIINYFATVDGANIDEVNGFRRACEENGIKFDHYGGAGYPGLSGKTTLKEKIQGIKDSYMAPTLQGQNQIVVGNTTDRVMNNLAYGQFPIVNNHYIDRLLGARTIYQPDTYKLFYEAKERLQSMPLALLHSLMDDVAKNWTYLNVIDAVETAIRIMESK